MSTCVYRCLPGCYNWNIIFRGGGSFTDDDDIVLELKRVSKALDGTYSLNPISPTEQTWSGGGDPYWPQRREELVNSANTVFAAFSQTNTKYILPKSELILQISSYLFVHQFDEIYFPSLFQE